MSHEVSDLEKALAAVRAVSLTQEQTIQIIGSPHSAQKTDGANA